MLDPPSFHTRPHLDEDGLLRFRDRWVAVSDAQLPVLSLLLERYGRVVPLNVLQSAYAHEGHATSRTAIRSALVRVRRTVHPLGLAVRTVRARGVMLVPMDL